MPFDFDADEPNMILSGAFEAFTSSAGTPNGSAFLYGTAAVGNVTFGVVVNFKLASTGDKKPIKGAAGVKLGTAIIDPGLQATAQIMYPLKLGRPKQGMFLQFKVPSETSGSADETLDFALMDWDIAWEQEGFRMINVTVERTAAQFSSVAQYSYKVNGDGTLGTSIASLD